MIYTLGFCDPQEKHPHSNNVAIHTGEKRLIGSEDACGPSKGESLKGGGVPVVKDRNA